MITLVILVTGGRGYANVGAVWNALRSTIGSRHASDVLVVQGGAKGTDALARRAAHALGCRGATYGADWIRHGRSAGPIRNERMLRLSQPDIVLAFPGGRGTADMVRRAKKAGVTVANVGGET